VINAFRAYRVAAKDKWSGRTHTKTGRFISQDSYPAIPSEEILFSQILESTEDIDPRISSLYREFVKFIVPKGLWWNSNKILVKENICWLQEGLSK
jgi:hypothetical protein